MGAVLYQEQGGVEKVISYASQSLSKSESKYPIHKLEFLCLKWAIADHFHKYLYGNTFDVYTDNNPLTYVLSIAKLDAMGHRWIAGLSTYNFHIHYKSGKSNIEGHALSRIDWEKCDETIQANSVQAIVVATITRDVANIEAVSCSVQAIESFFPTPSDTMAISKAITISIDQSCTTNPEPESSEVQTVSKTDDFDCLTLASRQSGDQLNPKCITKQNWVEAQSKDKRIGEIIHLFTTKELYCKKINETDNNEMKQFIRQHNKLFVRFRILYHKTEIHEMNHPDRSTMQLILPETFRKQVLQGCHDDLGRLRIEQMIDVLRDHFCWPRMLNNKTRHIKQCERCLKFRELPEKAPMENTDATYPMELIHMDYLNVEVNEGGKDVHILVITDHFT